MYLLANPQMNQSGSVSNPVRPYRLTLFCQNNIGYQHVMRLCRVLMLKDSTKVYPLLKRMVTRCNRGCHCIIWWP